MRTALPLFLLFAMFSSCSTPSFDDHLTRILEADPKDRIQLVTELSEQYTTSPIIEDTAAHIIYMGPKENMAVAGDFTGWNPANGKMTQIQGTDFWYLTQYFHRAAHLQYKLVSDTTDWFLDPRNPLTSSSDTDNSVIQMPDYEKEVYTEYRADLPHGSIKEYSIRSAYLADDRPFKVYYPAGYESSTAQCPLILVHDGFAYLEYGSMQNILDRLIHEQQIPASIAIFLPPKQRTEEYTGTLQAQYKSFIIEELYPWLTANTRSSTTAGEGIVMGSSYGGTISLSLAMDHPDVFGKVGAFSAYVADPILDTFSRGEVLPVHIYLNHGIYDHLLPIGESLKAFQKTLSEKGYSYAYREYPEAHHYEFWRAHLHEALVYLHNK